MTYHTTTTLREIRKHRQYMKPFKKLLAHLGKSEIDDETLELITVLDALGLDEALLTIDAVRGGARLQRHIIAAFAERVLHVFAGAYPENDAVEMQIKMLRNDEASDYERLKARGEARRAWGDAERASKWPAAAAAATSASDTTFEAAKRARESDRKTPRLSHRAAQELILREMIGDGK